MRTHSRTAQDTENFGWQLAAARPLAGQGFVALHLSGELGTGKTTFARGFLRGLGTTTAVRSPSYTLLELYPLAGLTAVHIDLYRLQDAAEVENLGLREWAGPGHLWLIEWPDKGRGHIPPADLTLKFSAAASGHGIEVRAGSAAGVQWLARLAGATPAVVEKEPPTP